MRTRAYKQGCSIKCHLALSPGNRKDELSRLHFIQPSGSRNVSFTSTQFILQQLRKRQVQGVIGILWQSCGCDLDCGHRSPAGHSGALSPLLLSCSLLDGETCKGKTLECKPCTRQAGFDAETATAHPCSEQSRAPNGKITSA